MGEECSVAIDIVAKLTLWQIKWFARVGNCQSIGLVFSHKYSIIRYWFVDMYICIQMSKSNILNTSYWNFHNSGTLYCDQITGNNRQTPRVKVRTLMELMRGRIASAGIVDFCFTQRCYQGSLVSRFRSQMSANEGALILYFVAGVGVNIQ